MKDMLNGVAEGESEDRSIKCDFLSRGLTCECFFHFPSPCQARKMKLPSMRGLH